MKRENIPKLSEMLAQYRGFPIVVAFSFIVVIAIALNPVEVSVNEYVSRSETIPISTAVQTYGDDGSAVVRGEQSCSLEDLTPEERQILQSAAEVLNRIEMNPGEILSLNDALFGGSETDVYLVAYGNGEGLHEEHDCVLCRISSLLYVAALKADFEIIERHNHEYVAEPIPMGLDALIIPMEADLKIGNTRSESIRIAITLTEQSIVVKLVGSSSEIVPIQEIVSSTVDAEQAEVFAGDEASGDEAVGSVVNDAGYAVDTYRVRYQDGSIVETEYLSRSVYHVR